jgi:peptidyl-tRNA hydrolase
MQEVFVGFGWAIAGVCTGFLGFHIYAKLNPKPQPPRRPDNPFRIPKPTEEAAEHKLVVGVRNDLKLKVSEVAALSTEIAIQVVVSALQEDPVALSQWYHPLQAKIFVRVDSSEDLENLRRQANEANVHCVVLPHNDVPAAIAFGPATSDVLDPITRRLNLI